MSVEQEMLRELISFILSERSREGLSDIKADDRLNRIASLQAAEMASHGYASHLGADGSSLASRCQRLGDGLTSFREAIAHGVIKPRSLVDRWLNSKNHRGVLLWGDAVWFGSAVTFTISDSRASPADPIEKQGLYLDTYWSFLTAR